MCTKAILSCPQGPQIREPKVFHHSEAHTEKSWEFFRKLGSPRFWVAPMVDQSELPFRMLCRKYGATGAYTPMLHAKIFSESDKYRHPSSRHLTDSKNERAVRKDEFSTCKQDRPLFAQFCANDPEYLLTAAQHVQHQVDAIDLNLGCPQRIAKRGRYGAFLMDELNLVEDMVKHVAQNLEIPVTCKIRVFPALEETLDYARRLERAQCSVLAVHGRTRDQKDQKTIRADWEVIRRIKQELSIPVLANGNVRDLQDAYKCLDYTGADGVLSAVSLLENPSLFTPISHLHQELDGSDVMSDRAVDDPLHHVRKVHLFKEYLNLVEQYPVKLGMVRAHMFRLLGDWLAEFVEIREQLNTQIITDLSVFRHLTLQLEKQIEQTGRLYPIPINQVTMTDADEPQRELQTKSDMAVLFQE